MCLTYVCHLAQSTVADLIEAEGCEYNGRRKGVIFEQVKTTVGKIQFRIRIVREEKVICELHPCVCYKSQAST